MKNWFYVYKNYSVESELVDALREYYLTEVKYVDRPEDFLSQKKVKVPAGLQGKPTDQLIDPEKEVEGIIQSSASGAPHKSDGEEANSGQQPALFDPVKNVDEEKKPQPETAEVKPTEETKEKVVVNEVKPSDEVMVAMQRSLPDSAEDMNGVTDGAVKVNKKGTDYLRRD